MNDDLLFIESVRSGDWAGALALTRTGELGAAMKTPSRSVFHWLIELDAPTILVVALLGRCMRAGSLDPNTLGLLEFCLEDIHRRSNAPGTFSALLALGLDPNVIADGGRTLFQKAMEWNRIEQVRELLRFGADANCTSIMGRESESNLEEALATDNASARFAVAWWKEHAEGG